MANAQVLVVAGGGGGGTNLAGGGGGGGGVIYSASFAISSGSYTVTIGDGGTPNNNGGNSVFGSLTAIGGGAGGGGQTWITGEAGHAGGSGGGGEANYNTSPAGGVGTAGQGNNGGTGTPYANSAYRAGGGGGAGAVGQNASSTKPGDGGVGAAYSISGTPTYYAGGGGGSSYSEIASSGGYGAGSLGGGGNGGAQSTAGVLVTGSNGVVNTGGGGGGVNGGPECSGGSGIVIVRYTTGTITATGGTITTVGNDTIHTFLSSSTFAVTATLETLSTNVAVPTRPLSQTKFINDDSLVAYWKLDGNSTDSKGGFNGTDTAVTYVDGLFGKVASFNGSSSKIVVPYNIALNVNNITISAWWKWDSPSVIGDNMIIDRLFSAGSVNPWASFRINAYVPDVNTRYFVCYIGKSSGVYGFINSTSLQLGVWYHVTFTYDGTYLRVYINGVENATAVNYTSGIGYGDNQGVTIGARMATSSDSYAKGLLDDISLFNRALSREEVAELYQSQTVGEIEPLSYKPQGGLYATSLINDANLVSYWKMDGNSRDSKGSNHGTDTSMTYGGAYGKFGQGASFNGSNYITVANSASLNFGTSNLSISFWVKTTQAADTWFIDKSNTASPYQGIYVGVIGTKLAFAITDCGTGGCGWGSTRHYVQSLQPINDNQWHYVTCVRTSTTYYLYIDGVLNNTRTEDARNADSTFPMYFRAFTGYLDDVVFFNRALSASEVFEIYSKGESSPLRPLEAVPTLRQDSSLYAYWRLNGNVLDSKNNANGTPTSINYSVGVNGRFGQAALMTNSSQITATIAQISSTFSVSWWLYPTSLVDYNQSMGPGWGIFLFHTTSTGAVYVGTDGTNRLTATELPAGTVTINAWQHFTFTFSGGASSGTGKLYKNGVLLASKAGMLNPVNFTTFSIGAVSSTSAIVGRAQDVSLFTRELSPPEVYQLYTQGSTLGYWKLNGNSVDFSGNGNHGTDTAITYGVQSGKFGLGALFNGTSSLITFTDSISLKPLGPYTISQWVKIPSIPAATSYLFNSFYTSPSNNGILILIQSGTGYIGLDSFTNGTEYYILSTTNVCDNNWHHVVGIYDGSGATGAKIYVDGVLQKTSTSWATQTYNATNYARIGAYYDGSNRGYFSGSLEEVIIENRPWSASEIRKYYTQRKLNY